MRIAITYSNPAKASPYADAVRQAGGDPVRISAADRVRSLDGFAGLLLSGGPDLNPELYQESSGPHTERPNDARDALEAALLREALERDVPVLAICRGLQLFNVVHRGGTLLQHIEGHVVKPADPSLPAHPALIEPGSALSAIVGTPQLPVNSRHHQAVANVGEGLSVSARAPDGVVEGLERPDLQFAVAVQWHPEDQWRFPPQQEPFRAFVRACRDWSPHSKHKFRHEL